MPKDIAEMSDEEFMKINPAVFEREAQAESDTNESADDNTDTTEDDIAGESIDDSESNIEDESTDETDDQNEADDSKPDKTDVKDHSDTTKDATNTITNTQYADIGKQVMAEFKANGTTIKVKSAEDAIKLMQMGANYHKKMAGLKPSLKTLKLLENNGLLDTDKLNYLIDLSQKKPEAITQLLKDSNIDPMTIDLQSEEKYVPNNRTINDTELVLDEVLESISSSPSYNKTLTVLGEIWDAKSRTSVAENPEVIRTINMHMDSGIYDQVADAVAYDRSLGKLVGVSDFEAYQRVGSYMYENNLFHTANESSSISGHSQNNSLKTQLKTDNDEQLKQRLNRKQAASPSRQQKSPIKDDSNYNPLEMSDEDFIKLHKLNI